MKKDGHIDFSEFVQYVMEHERRLQISFEELDRNKDGRLKEIYSSFLGLKMNIFSGVIDAREIVEAFKEIGIDMDIEEATFILQKYI